MRTHRKILPKHFLSLTFSAQETGAWHDIATVSVCSTPFASHTITGREIQNKVTRRIKRTETCTETCLPLLSVNNPDRLWPLQWEKAICDQDSSAAFWETGRGGEKATDGASDLGRFKPLICKQDYRLRGPTLLSFPPREFSIQTIFQSIKSPVVFLKGNIT